MRFPEAPQGYPGVGDDRAQLLLQLILGPAREDAAVDGGARSLGKGILGVARHHHERWDGTGYPDGLAGTAIPLEARIVAVADSLDAITSTRAFRQARLWSEAVEEIIEAAGTRYDPDVVTTFEAAQDRLLIGA